MARTKYDPTEARERAQEKVREALTLLEAGIAAIIDGESFARYLRTLARFHTYSIHNALLIQAQRTDATRVAGYRAWQALGRQVRNGERGIVILVPLGTGSRAKGDEAAQNTQNTRNADEDGGSDAPTVGNAPRVVARFGVGYVFDVAQTDGEPLPEPPSAQLLHGASDLGAALWEALEGWLVGQGVAVALEDCGRANGYYDPLRRHVAVHTRLAGTDHAAKTLAHEAAHCAAAHRGDMDRREVETVAEGAAYVVLQRFGLDASGYTFAYVATWARDKAVLKRNLEAIRQVASDLIEALEARLDVAPATLIAA